MYRYFIILKSTSERRKRDLYRRTSFIALSVCKIRFCHETCPTDGRRAKTAVITYKLETTRVFSIAGEDSPFLCLVRSCLASFYEHIPLSSPFSLVRCHEHERGSSPWYVIRFPNHRILSSCRLMFYRSSGKGKTQIGMAKFQGPKGVRGNLHTRKGVVFRRKNFANPILLPLIGPQERTNGDRKTQKKTVDSRKRN